MQTAHPDWLIFHSSRSGLWSAYRSVLSGRPYPGKVLLVRAESAEELDRKLAAQVSPVVPPSIQAVAVARALQARTAWGSRAVHAVGPGRSTALRRLLRS
ncbi:hypothetical protein ACFYY8_12680 [Streptosporangium sp. NPDC001559]|uniref:hypothetical protein n=1 Tax=Streptosporangium sp. NPDC001559 TaxID=3366187 RepID=UPI0036E22B5C